MKKKMNAQEMMNKDDPEAGDDDTEWKEIDDDSLYVPQSDVDDIRNNEPEPKSDRPTKIRKFCGPHSNRKMKSDGSTSEKNGEESTSRVKDGTSLERSKSQLQLVEDTVPSRHPARYEKANGVVEGVDEQWNQIARRTPWLGTQSIIEKQEAASQYVKRTMIPHDHQTHLFLKKHGVLFLKNIV